MKIQSGKLKNSQKIHKKSLDKSYKIWYNKDTIKRTKTLKNGKELNDYG
jgi:hypothetical protein